MNYSLILIKQGLVMQKSVAMYFENTPEPNHNT